MINSRVKFDRANFSQTHCVYIVFVFVVAERVTLSTYGERRSRRVERGEPLFLPIGVVRLVPVFPLSMVIPACQIGDSSVSVAECARLFRPGCLGSLLPPDILPLAFFGVVWSARPWSDTFRPTSPATPTLSTRSLARETGTDTDIHYTVLAWSTAEEKPLLKV